MKKQIIQKYNKKGRVHLQSESPIWSHTPTPEVTSTIACWGLWAFNKYILEET